jgi:hypothetical protein
LYESEEAVAIANRLASEKKLNVIEIHSGYEKISSDRHKCDVGPLELLGYIANADYVLTTSFHGLVFSLIFEKEVWAIDKGQNERLRNLMNKTGIYDRLILSYGELRTSKKISYDLIYKYFSEERLKTKHYLTF